MAANIFHYLTMPRGTGLDLPNAFAPAGSDPGFPWMAYDFREAKGRMILVTAQALAPTVQIVKLSDDPTAINPTAAGLLQGALGGTFVPDTPDGLVAQAQRAFWPAPPLVLPTGTPSLVVKPSAGVSVHSFADNFNRPNEIPLSGGGNWGPLGGGDGQLNLIGNQAQGSGGAGTRSDSRVSGVAGWTAAQYAQGKLTSVGADQGGPAVRCNGAALTCYFSVCKAAGSNIYKVVAGVFTSLAAGAAFAVNDIAKLTAQSGLLVLYDGPTPFLSAVDTAIVAADPPGWLLSGAETFDDFLADNLTTLPGGIIKSRMNY